MGPGDGQNLNVWIRHMNTNRERYVRKKDLQRVSRAFGQYSFEEACQWARFLLSKEGKEHLAKAEKGGCVSFSSLVCDICDILNTLRLFSPWWGPLLTGHSYVSKKSFLFPISPWRCSPRREIPNIAITESLRNARKDSKCRLVWLSNYSKWDQGRRRMGNHLRLSECDTEQLAEFERKGIYIRKASHNIKRMTLILFNRFNFQLHLYLECPPTTIQRGERLQFRGWQYVEAVTAQFKDALGCPAAHFEVLGPATDQPSISETDLCELAVTSRLPL